MKKQRKQYTPEEKVAILRRHLLEKEPISKLCDEMGLQPTVFYRWQKELFENGAAAFEQKRPTNHSADQERIACLREGIKEGLASYTGVAAWANSPADAHRAAASELAGGEAQPSFVGAFAYASGSPYGVLLEH